MSTRHKETEEEEEVIIKKHWDLDMFTLKEVGIYKSLEERLRQHYTSPNNGCVYRYYDDWEFLMYSDRKVFKDLCEEFHSSYDIEINPKDVDDDEFMRFNLGGKPRNMSLYEFSRVLRIYSDKEVDDDWDVFRDYIWSGARISDDINNNNNNEAGFDPKKVWKKFSSTTSWVEGKVSRMDIDDVVNRLIHMFLNLNIFHRSEEDTTNKVTLSDLWYLEQISTREKHVSIPYSVAYYLKHFAVVSGGKGQRIICGGHFVTKIAQHYGVIGELAGEPDQLLPGLRGNPMITVDQYLDINLPGLTRFQRVEKKLIKKDEPIDHTSKAAGHDEYEQEQNMGMGAYERVMSTLKEDHHLLSATELTEIQKTIDELHKRLSIGKMENVCQVEEEEKKIKKNKKKKNKNKNKNKNKKNNNNNNTSNAMMRGG